MSSPASPCAAIHRAGSHGWSADRPVNAIRNRLGDPKRPPIHVLHFDGHGTFDEEVDEQVGLHLSGGKQGMLAFENDEGKLDLVKAEDVVQILQDSGVRLAMLTACQSAMSTADDAFSSVAARLIKSGVDVSPQGGPGYIIVESSIAPGVLSPRAECCAYSLPSI